MTKNHLLIALGIFSICFTFALEAKACGPSKATMDDSINTLRHHPSRLIQVASRRIPQDHSLHATGVPFKLYDVHEEYKNKFTSIYKINEKLFKRTKLREKRLSGEITYGALTWDSEKQIYKVEFRRKIPRTEGGRRANSIRPEFDPGAISVIDPTESSIIPDGLLQFVTDVDGEILVSAKAAQGAHVMLGLLDQVRYAGDITFDKGKLLVWDNQSGTYYCEKEYAEQALLPIDLFQPLNQTFYSLHPSYQKSDYPLYGINEKLIEEIQFQNQRKSPPPKAGMLFWDSEAKAFKANTQDEGFVLIPHGRYAFITNRIGETLIKPLEEFMSEKNRYQITIGSHALLGKHQPVLFGGEIDFSEGKILQWTNHSEIYDFDAVSAHQAGLPMELFHSVTYGGFLNLFQGLSEETKL